MRIDAGPLHYRQLNERIHRAVNDGTSRVELDNVRGHRYIGAGLGRGICITVNGVPGNDLGSFMNGAELIVNGNVQDGVGNTMNQGKIIIHGHAGDIPAHSMRGGRIFVRGRVAYRAGIHMKAFRERFPVLVVGETAGDYAGEYMAGGVIVVLNLAEERGSPVGNYLGTGMHGGTIYLRGPVEPHQLGKEVGKAEMGAAEWSRLRAILDEYRRDLGLDVDFRPDEFTRLVPQTTRPYGRLYAY